MESEAKHPDLSREQKARLLQLGLDSEEATGVTSAEDRKAHLLFDLLATPLPVDPETIDFLPPILRSLCRLLKSVAGEPLVKLLQDPQVDLTVLKRIKEYTKQLGDSTTSHVEHDVGLVLYYAAIASGLIYHNQRISRYSYAELKEAFSGLIQQDWIPQDLIEMFTRACEYCSQKAE